MNNQISPPAIVESVEENMVALQGLITRQAEALVGVKEAKKLIREQEKSILENDAEYQKRLDEAGTFVQAVKEQKAVVKGTPMGVELAVKKKELLAREKELKSSMSGHLINYRTLTGSNVFDTPDGGQVEFAAKASFSPKQLSLFG